MAGVSSTGGTSPTIVKSVILFDCDTRLAATGQCLMSDGTFEKLKMYPANDDDFNPSFTCVDGDSVFNLVDCNLVPVSYFCLPDNFTCNYLESDGFSSAETCTPN